MGRSPCCDKVGLKKGPWIPEEDQKLLAYIEEHGHGSWRALPGKAGLQRCGKSCRLRWTNYLRPDIKRGKFTMQEEQTIIQLHALLGNRWSAIATHLPKRTDNEIKNYWNTHLKKRLAKMGIDPVTHKPQNEALIAGDGQSNKNAANISHMAQWESARLEAEARLVRESKLRSRSFQLSGATTTSSAGMTFDPLASTSSRAAWNAGGGCDMESPTSTLTFSENPGTAPPPSAVVSSGIDMGTIPQMIEFVGTSGSADAELIEDEGEGEWKEMDNSVGHFIEYKQLMEKSVSFGSNLNDVPLSMDGFTSLLLNESVDDRSLSESGKESENSGGGSDYYEDNKNYWNSILNLVNSSPSDSPMF